MRGVSRVFSHAVELGLIDVNPLQNVKNPAPPKMTEVEEDRGYIEAEIERLFNSELFNNVDAERPYGVSCYWIPLLCRYTGARINEITQLYKYDIDKKVISGTDVYYINIRRGKGQTVKNNASLRHIPIPEHIIELGFLDYVEASGDVLFPNIPGSKKNRPSSTMGTWWGDRVREAGIVIKQPSHGFRHTFKTALRSAEVEDSVSDAITGHAPKTQGGKYGTVELIIKKKAIDCLPRLPITRLDFK